MLTPLHRAKLQARGGNVVPLREMYPEIAPFIHAPVRKRRPGQPGDPWSKYVVRMADAEAREIRRLWKAYFGKSKRNDARHLKIAADRAGLTVKDLVYYRGEKTRKKTRKRRS